MGVFRGEYTVHLTTVGYMCVISKVRFLMLMLEIGFHSSQSESEGYLYRGA